MMFTNEDDKLINELMAIWRSKEISAAAMSKEIRMSYRSFCDYVNKKRTVATKNRMKIQNYIQANQTI